MASKLENIIYKTYNDMKGGETGGADQPKDKSADDDTSTVDTDTSEIMKRLAGNEDEGDEEGSILMESDEDDDIPKDSDASEDEDTDSYEDEDDGEQGAATTTNPPKTKVATNPQSSDAASEGESESDTDDDEDYLQKLDDSVRHNIIGEYHPEMIQHNDEEVETLCKIVRDADGVIIDPFHKTLPFVTKYEKARILGERAKQINSGAKPFIPVEKHIIDGYLIALREFEEKKIPFIVRRPLPNGGSEYWKLADLQILD